MLVRELIERLAACNPEAEVVLAWDTTELDPLGRVEAGVALIDPDLPTMWITKEAAGDMVMLGCPKNMDDADWSSVALWPKED